MLASTTTQPSLQVVINLIRNTTTTQGLEVEARLDENL